MIMVDDDRLKIEENEKIESEAKKEKGDETENKDKK